MYGFRTILLLSAFFFIALPAAYAQGGGEAELADKYFEDGEYAQAQELYEKLYKLDPANRHAAFRIVACFEKARNYGDAIKFLDKAIRREPDAYDFEIQKAAELEKNGELKEAEKTLNTLIHSKLKTIGDFAGAAAFFLSLENNDRAVQTLLEGRKVQRNDNLFSEELGTIYKRMGKYDLATLEFLKVYFYDAAAYEQTKENILNMVGPSSATAIETVLLEAVQKNQKDPGIRTLIFDFYVLTTQFMEALMQVKAIDKVFSESGERVFQFAMTMRSNHNYSLSNKALDYIIENHPESPYYFQAYKEKTVNGEMEAFEKVPLDSAAIRGAVKAYDDFLNTFGRNISFFDAMYRKARLQAFYLFDLDGAMTEISHAVALPVKPKEKAEANLLIGDIFLMQKEFNKAKLKYAEVDAQFKDEQIGALAKFKDAQLSYYKGDFEESQARLKSIKDNTSNDISNDAIRLFLLIQDNIGMDSNTTALQRFARAQLCVFQRDYADAMAILDSVEYEYPNHPLQDEIIWEKANIFLAGGQQEEGLKMLEKILEKFSTDIYGDDALWTLARIYDYNLKDPAKAMEYYMRLLRDFPGSLFAVSVRKRIRELRNDRL